LRSALARLQAGVAPEDVAADLLRKHAERVILYAPLPPGDPRLPAVVAFSRALGMRTLDDSAISLDACLADVQEAWIDGRQSAGRPSPLMRSPFFLDEKKRAHTGGCGKSSSLALSERRYSRGSCRARWRSEPSFIVHQAQAWLGFTYGF
jgi:hypothetical protein